MFPLQLTFQELQKWTMFISLEYRNWNSKQTSVILYPNYPCKERKETKLNKCISYDNLWRVIRNDLLQLTSQELQQRTMFVPKWWSLHAGKNHETSVFETSHYTLHFHKNGCGQQDLFSNLLSSSILRVDIVMGTWAACARKVAKLWINMYISFLKLDCVNFNRKPITDRHASTTSD